MTRELSPLETFQEKVKHKLQKDFADMLPDQVLAGMVRTTFKDLLESDWFKDMIKNCVEARMKEIVNDVIASDMCKSRIDEVIAEGIIAQSVNIHIADFLSNLMRNSVQDMIWQKMNGM